MFTTVQPLVLKKWKGNFSVIIGGTLKHLIIEEKLMRLDIVNYGLEETKILIIVSVLFYASPEGAYATGRLEDSGRQNDEKMWRETVHSQSYATFFRHSAVLSLPAVLLRKVLEKISEISFVPNLLCVGNRKEWLPSPNVGALLCTKKHTDHGNVAGFSFLFAELREISLKQEAYRSFNLWRCPRYNSKREALKLCLCETF